MERRTGPTSRRSGRFGTLEQIADAVSFLTSDPSSFITGEVVDLNSAKGL